MNYYTRALELKEEAVQIRRYLHEHGETGLDLPVTKKYVKEQLKQSGIDPVDCGYGVSAVIGKGNPVILLRADMDALPMEENSGEPFSCKTGAMHACGHDFHATMLLLAAKMLKEREEELCGTVKLMFQPAEETFQGCENMLANGILQEPVPDAALAYHVVVGRIPVGVYMYNAGGTMMNSVDGFKITIHGKGTHGACPHMGVDPINIGVHIHLALQELIARESNPADSCVMTIGQFQGGKVANVIPDEAVLQGTLRTNNQEARKKLVERMKEVAQRTAQVYNGSVTIEMLSQVPPLCCEKELTEEMAGYMEELAIPGMMAHKDISATASEDFAVIADKIPSTYMYLSAGYMDERGDYPVHHSKARFNEEVLPIGAACYAQCAQRWLENHK